MRRTIIKWLVYGMNVINFSRNSVEKIDELRISLLLRVAAQSFIGFFDSPIHCYLSLSSALFTKNVHCRTTKKK